MKQDLFKIESDEIKRILSLHEERSKNQYLNIVSEEIPNIEYNVVPNVKYNSVPNEKIISKKQIPIGKESYTIGKEFKYYDLENATKGNGDELRLMSGTKFVKSTKTPNTLITQNVRIDFPQNLTGKVESTDTATANVYYNCKYGKFGIINVKGNTNNNKFVWYDENKDLTNQLKSVCQYKLPKQEPIKQKEVKSDSNKKTIVTQKKQLNPQQFVTQTIDYTKQIQTSLGSQTPTGQLTDTDIDTILAKLG